MAPVRWTWLVEDQVAAAEVLAAEELPSLAADGFGVVFFLTDGELPEEALTQTGVEWSRLPLREGRAPEVAELEAFVSAAREARERGQRVAVVCGGPVSRAGVFAAAYLVAQGMDPARAISEVRRKRPGSLEALALEQAVERYAEQLGQRPRATKPAPKAELYTEGLVKIYGGRAVVNGVSLTLNRGEIVGLLGPNGAGKTTTFYMVVGLVRPNKGRVVLDGRDVTRLPMHRRAHLGIGYLAQEPSVFRRLTVWENLMAILELRRDLTRAERRERAEELLERLKIAHLRHSRGYALSGGERRRVEIARCLATSPAFILLDEPFTGVDPRASQEIQQIITDLRQDNIGIFVTDHSVRETLEITDRAYIMFDGRILVSGTPDELIDDEVAQQFYFGDAFDLNRMPSWMVQRLGARQRAGSSAASASESNAGDRGAHPDT